jgi:integrase
MPAINEKVEVLRGVVFSYVTAPEKYYYREYNEDTQKYRYKIIKGARDIEEAKRLALDVFSEFRQEEASPSPLRIAEVTPKDRTPYSRLLEPLIDQWLREEKEKSDKGLLSVHTWLNKRVSVGLHLREYFKMNGILRTHQFTASTLDNYQVYRASTTRLTRNKELRVIQVFKNWLARHDYLPPKVASQKVITLEKIKDEDLTANPAICPEDWEVIIRSIRSWRAAGLSNPNHKTYYWRTLFWTFCLVMKNSGMRPIELLQLRWRDVELLPLTAKEEEQRRTNKMSSALTDKVATTYIFVRKSKTRVQREVPCKVGRELRRWKDFLDEYLSKYGKEAVTGDGLIFGNCDNEWRAYLTCNYSQCWRKIVSELYKLGKLKGHKYSDRRYTVYSMRATFIEDNLLQDGGIDIFYLATICGHSVQILQRHYERITVRSRMDELAPIPYGKKRREERETMTLY